MEVEFIVNPEDTSRCSFGDGGKYGFWDVLNQKMWIWLFRFNPDENTIIDRVSYVIEHEWLHELLARYVDYKYRGIFHYIISHLQSWREKIEEKRGDRDG